MNNSACFTGHRKITEDREKLSERLYALLESLVTEQRITDFYTGGAIGFDTLAALTVLRLRESYPHIRLHLVLPCPFEEQSAGWTDTQKEEYRYIASLADTKELTSEHYNKDAMKVRNVRLVELADEYCICCWNVNNFRSGTGQTVRMAERKGIKILNLFENH